MGPKKAWRTGTDLENPIEANQTMRSNGSINSQLHKQLIRLGYDCIFCFRLAKSSGQEFLFRRHLLGSRNVSLNWNKKSRSYKARAQLGLLVGENAPFAARP